MRSRRDGVELALRLAEANPIDRLAADVDVSPGRLAALLWKILASVSSSAMRSGSEIV
jgi:hypothetical protein